jgi:hypothetical protein
MSTEELPKSVDLIPAGIGQPARRPSPPVSYCLDFRRPPNSLGPQAGCDRLQCRPHCQPDIGHDDETLVDPSA